MAWYDWVVLTLSLCSLAAYGTAVWRDRPRRAHKPPAPRRARTHPPAPFDPNPDPNRPYQVYCRDFDVEADANTLDERLGLPWNSVSEKRFADIQKDLADWRADCESSVVHAAARIRAATGQDTLGDTVVSLLVDHSGSMRGKSMELAAKAVLTASTLLEALGAKQEVLGFTTVRWKGGRSRERWLESGRPPLPGRLNDLLHIVYCRAGERPKAHRYATMMREEILKENLDGEAVEWAASRLRKREESRKYLIVISDGAPVDDSTLAVNPGTYLENHLRGVIEEIAQAGDVQLAAIGLGHDVDRYYERSVAVTTLDEDPDLGWVTIKLLEQLLCPPQKSRS